MSDLYEPIFRNLLFPAYESMLRRRSTLRYLRQYEASQWLSPEQVQALQWEKLRRLLAHCWANVPYYRERWSQLGIGHSEDISSVADYARLPVLTKAEIRGHFDRLIARGHESSMLYKTTGGSTGEPLRFGYTRESYERRLAVMWRGYGWTGARLGQRTFYLWGTAIGAQRLKDRLYHRSFNRLMLNAFEMSEANLPSYVESLNRFRPRTVVSYVAPMLKLCDWILSSGTRVHRPERILCAAEALHEHQRRRIEEAFGCPVYNTYGCREFMLIAAECEHRSGLHVNADHLRVELGAADPGADEPGEVIVTDLHNFGMPLLRYANGDLATEGRGTCGCGRGLPMLHKVDGRKLDALRTPDGRFVPGEFIVYAFLAEVGIARYQVVQRVVDAFEINIQRGIGFEEASVERVRAELRKVVGDSVALNFSFIDQIPLTATGKLRVTASEIT